MRWWRGASWRSCCVTALVWGFVAVGGGASVDAAGGRFGVIIGGKGRLPHIVELLKDLGADWVRINTHMDGAPQDFSAYLDAGINVVITFDNHDPANSETVYGTPEEFTHAGFPFKSKAAYQARIRETLTPLLPYLARGRQIWVQCENEIGDASLNPKARYWRGTVDQYLAQLRAFDEAVHGLDPSIPVVLSSLTSEGLNHVTHPDPNDPRSRYVSTFFTRLLTEGTYDAVDLHFYHCAEDIPAKVQWVKARMPAGKRWISTENGGPDTRCPSTPTSWDENPTQYEQRQAEQVSKRLAACADNGGSVCLWFSFLDLRGETSVFRHMGLIDTSEAFQQLAALKQARGKGGGGPSRVSRQEAIEDAFQSLRKKLAYSAFKSFVASHR